MGRFFAAGRPGFAITVVSAASALVVAVVAATSAAQAKAPEVHNSKLCKSYEHVVVQRRAEHYVVRNDNFGHFGECLANRNGSPNFAVVSSGARGGPVEPVAFPNIFVGCSWGICSPRTHMPVRVSKIKSLLTTWHTKARAKGTWAAGYDIWFDRKPVTSGQSGGAELMIWLSSRGVSKNTGPVVKVNGHKWRLEHWVTQGHGKKWNYIQFRRVKSTSKVTGLDVKKFIAVARERGLIRANWWLANVEAGFEIWRGGVGLSTTRFAVHLQR